MLHLVVFLNLPRTLYEYLVVRFCMAAVSLLYAPHWSGCAHCRESCEEDATFENSSSTLFVNKGKKRKSREIIVYPSALYLTEPSVGLHTHTRLYR
jgi:hypothetical protein